MRFHKSALFIILFVGIALLYFATFSSMAIIGMVMIVVAGIELGAKAVKCLH